MAPLPDMGPSPLSPVDALDRIVYLLDRSLAPTTKVRAFLRARDVAGEVGDDELGRLHAANRCLRGCRGLAMQQARTGQRL